MLRVTAEEQVKQFPEDLYSDDGILFCKFCDHSVDYVGIDTIKDHMKSKKHTQRKDQKEAGSSATTHQQVTLTRSRDLREEFVIDFLKMATMADIPVDKVEKMKPLLLNYSKQAGTLPMAATLRSTYIPRLFDQHFSALKQLLLESTPTPIHITADETTDCRDHSILNVFG